MYTIEEAVDYIYDIPKHTSKNKEDNTKYMLRKIGFPMDGTSSIKIIHVAGTNGKGSVCSYISTVLTLAGKKTGLFVSPHLVKINERIQINNEMISDEKFMEAFNQMLLISSEMEDEGYNHPTFFEFLFGVGMIVFMKEEVEYLVLETGLGGRLDATNAIPNPMLSVITSISFDHMQYLGDTIPLIASEKAGIIKSCAPVVFWGEDKEVKTVVTRKAERVGTKAVTVDYSQISAVVLRDKFIDFCLNNRYYNSEHLCVSSIARYQVANSALAATALKVLLEADDDLASVLTNDIIINGIKKAFWEGRMEEILPEVYVDGAHNEDGIRQFLNTATAMNDREQLLMFSAVSDKNFELMIEELCTSNAFSRFVVCTVEDPKRAYPAGEFTKLFRKYTAAPVYTVDSVEDALDMLLSLKNENNRAFITGSLYLVGTVKEYIESKKSANN